MVGQVKFGQSFGSRYIQFSDNSGKTSVHRGMEEDQMLMTADMRQALIDAKMSKYEKCVVRFLFPDKFVIQGTFRPRETGSNVN